MAAVEIKVYLVAVKADLRSGLTEMVIKIVILIASAIEIIEELIVFIGYKMSKLKIFRVTITVTRRVGKSVKIIKQ